MYFLGMDVGGTKTDVVLTDSNQRVLLNKKFGGNNIHNSSSPEIMKRLIKLMRELATSMKVAKNKSELFGCVSLASFDTTHDAKVWRQMFIQAQQQAGLSFPRLLLVSDAYCSLMSGTYARPAACLIVGTGANGYAIDVDGKEVKAGDWGFLLGDQGSGFWIGQRLLWEVVKELDCRLPKTSLTPAVLKFFSCSSLDDLIDSVYHQNTVGTIASTVEVLNDQRLLALPRVKSVCNQAIFELSSTVSTLIHQLNVETSLPLVCTGGMFHHLWFTKALVKELRENLPQVQPVFPTQKPVYTALDLAGFDKYEKLPQSAQLIIA